MLTSPSKTEVYCVAAVGRESVGKSQLISTLTGCAAGEANFRGSTVAVDRYDCDAVQFIDTPGILRKSDSETTRLALQELHQQDVVMLVVQATSLDDDLAEMLPLVVGKRGVVIVTFWDKVQLGEAAFEAIERLSLQTGVEFIPVDARNLTAQTRERVSQALHAPREFAREFLTVRAGWRIAPKAGLLEHRFLGPLLAIVLLFLPALATIYGANRFADWLHPHVANAVEPLILAVNTHAPVWLKTILTAESEDFGYGLLNMGPFLLVWAFPTVLLFSVILAVYKASGLIERVNVAIHPLARPIGLSGRDVIRVMMGFGCNVPAVISTRSCSSCSRGPAISAIAFGSACSYQLPATLAVLAASAEASAVSSAGAAAVFLVYLLATTLIYLRLTSGAEARSSLNLLLAPTRPFMQWPRFGALLREVRSTIQQFVMQAMPIFAIICIIAAFLSELGVLSSLSASLGPVMSLFNLPTEAALPVVLASIRKDGIFLFAAEDGLAMPMNIVQTLTAVYLAGVLLPCLVTALTIARETSWRRAASILLRQAGFAILFSLILAWGGWWLI